MTLDEAIKHAEEVAIDQDLCCSECAEEHRQLAEWLKDYKQLLEQQPSEDCVSRQSMLDAITEIDENINMDIYTNEVREIVKELPPVTPIHKVGYWDKTGGSFRCSECMHMPEFRDIRTLKYCPNCGAEMRGAEND